MPQMRDFQDVVARPPSRAGWRRGVLAVLLFAAIVLYGAFIASGTTWKYYMSVDECRRQGLVGANGLLRVSGRVVPGSLRIAPDRRTARLQIAGDTHRIRVRYGGGPLPDNLEEGREIVVEGRMGAHSTLEATRILTRCASKYTAQPSGSGDRPAPSDCEDLPE